MKTVTPSAAETGTDSDVDRPRVALIELYASGHHGTYLEDLVEGLTNLPITLCVEGGAELSNFLHRGELNTIIGCEQLAGMGGFRRQRIAQKLFEDGIKRAQEWQASHVHFLYADWHLNAIATAWRNLRPRAHPVLTIHWSTGAGVGGSVKEKFRRYPQRRALQWMMRNTSALVMVHHQAVKVELKAVIDERRISVVPYPARALPAVSLQKQREFRSEINIPEQCKLILCYGGTRKDKGADLAVAVLSKLPESFHLLLAGKSDFFQPTDLIAQATVLGVEKRLHLMPRYLSEDETSKIFHACDIVLLPYRANFSGQSGPLMQAAAACKPVVASDLAVIGGTVRTFNIGVVFSPENIDSMADAIFHTDVDKIKTVASENFMKYHSPLSFAKNVYEIFEKQSIDTSQIL